MTTVKYVKWNYPQLRWLNKRNREMVNKMATTPTETQWLAALCLLREAAREIDACDSAAQGSYWYGNELADRITEFLKSLDAATKAAQS